MLKAVVEYENLALEILNSVARGRCAVRVADDRGYALQRFCKQARLVTSLPCICEYALTVGNHYEQALVFASVAARQYRDAATLTGHYARDPFNERRLTRAACCDVADAYDRRIDLINFESASFVEGTASASYCAIESAERGKDYSLTLFHAESASLARARSASPRSDRLRAEARSGARSFIVSAVAPRFLSKTARAFSAIVRLRFSSARSSTRMRASAEGASLSGVVGS